MQRPHREINPRPSALYGIAAKNYATEYACFETVILAVLPRPRISKHGPGFYTHQLFYDVTETDDKIHKQRKRKMSSNHEIV